MKEQFTKKPVLAAPDIDKKMRMEVDASDYVTGGVLSMECKDSLWRPVAFLSKSLNKTERNYEIHDKEMLAIIRGLEAWRHLLEGAQFKFEIWTDYNNLEYFMKVQKLNRRQARWVLYLSRFDFTLKYVAETKMEKANRLSRRADWKVGTERDNENQVFIKDNWIRSMQEVIVEGPEVELLEKIKKARNKNEDVVRVVEEMKKMGVKELQENEWQIEGDLVLKEGKVYIPKDEELRVEVVRLHHDTPAVGHGGRWKTVELVTRNYWCVVATTRHSRTNDLTTSKALSRLLSNEWEITRELDKEPSLHCSSIYINTKWSVLQQCVSLMSIHHAFTSCSLLILYASSLRPPCFLHVP